MEGQRIEQTAGYGIIAEAASQVLNIYNQRQEARLVFHNYQFTKELAEKVDVICREEGLPEGVRETAGLAAWFLNTGYLFNYRQQVDYSVRLAAKFLEEYGDPDVSSAAVLSCIRRVAEGEPPQSDAEKVLSDACRITAAIEDFANRNLLLQLEREFMLEEQLSKLEWAKLQLQQLLQVKLHTHYARSTYENTLAQNILNQKSSIDKWKKRALSEHPADTPPANFQGLEGEVPGRATQTFFRANYRNHINLSAIADNKANIMISVNSILISVLITALTYHRIAETNPKVLLPAIIFLVSGLASLIFAVLSARPKVTNLNKEAQNQQDVQKNIVFFGNFVHLDLDQYEEAVDAMFRSNQLLYGNMVRDLYYLGKVLDKKYRYLSISYNIFMVGFIATVGSFLLALFT